MKAEGHHPQCKHHPAVRAQKTLRKHPEHKERYVG
jgi:hypothetical protein